MTQLATNPAEFMCQPVVVPEGETLDPTFQTLRTELTSASNLLAQTTEGLANTDTAIEESRQRYMTLIEGFQSIVRELGEANAPFIDSTRRLKDLTNEYTALREEEAALPGKLEANQIQTDRLHIANSVIVEQGAVVQRRLAEEEAFVHKQPANDEERNAILQVFEETGGVTPATSADGRYKTTYTEQESALLENIAKLEVEAAQLQRRQAALPYEIRRVENDLRMQLAAHSPLAERVSNLWTKLRAYGLANRIQLDENQELEAHEEKKRLRTRSALQGLISLDSSVYEEPREDGHVA